VAQIGSSCVPDHLIHRRNHGTCLSFLAFGFFFPKNRKFFSRLPVVRLVWFHVLWSLLCSVMRETLWHYQLGAKQSRDAAFSCFLCKLEREEVREREREKGGGGGGGGGRASKEDN
jgi:hypothetical protein